MVELLPLGKIYLTHQRHEVSPWMDLGALVLSNPRWDQGLCGATRGRVSTLCMFMHVCDFVCDFESHQIAAGPRINPCHINKAWNIRWMWLGEKGRILPLPCCRKVSDLRRFFFCTLSNTRSKRKGGMCPTPPLVDETSLKFKPWWWYFASTDKKRILLGNVSVNHLRWKQETQVKVIHWTWHNCGLSDGTPSVDQLHSSSGRHVDLMAYQGCLFDFLFVRLTSGVLAMMCRSTLQIPWTRGSVDYLIDPVLLQICFAV